MTPSTLAELVPILILVAILILAHMTMTTEDDDE